MPYLCQFSLLQKRLQDHEFAWTKSFLMDSFIQAYPTTGYAQKNKTKQNKTKTKPKPKKREKKHKQLE
jgi:outer membrane protein assembly factor BamD (BamD/ComL family)